jgi:hypothetical protein
MLLLVFVIPFELGYIGEPFLVWFICCELSVQDIFCNELRIICLACASEVSVLNRRFNIFGSAYPQCSLVVYLDAMFTEQVIIDPPVAFGWILHMDLLHFFGDERVLSDSFANIAT